MKKFTLLLFVSFFVYKQSDAQITITRADFGTIGDVLQYANDTSTATLSVGSAGANMTWDFSTAATANYYDSTRFLDPSTLPGAPVEANLALESGNQPDFFYFDSTQVKVIAQLDNFGLDNQAVKIITFPFTYLSTLRDSVRTSSQGKPEDYGFSGTPYDSIRITIDIITTSLVDGWGTLKIGSDVYNNTLRIKNKTNAKVDVQGKLPIIGWSPVPVNLNRTDEMYTWYGQGKKYALAEAPMDTSGKVGSFRYQVNSIPGPTGLKTVSPLAVKNMYPNPANTELTVELKSPYKEAALIQITDITGKVVLSQTIDLSGNMTQAMINTAELPNGIYLARFTSAHTGNTAKFIVQH